MFNGVRRVACKGRPPLNESPFLTNFDIVAAAGSKDMAVVAQLATNARTGGDYLIQFTSLVNNSLVSAIEIW